MSDKNVSIYRGVVVKDHPMIRLRVSQYEFKKFIDARLDKGLSAREVLENTVQPCERCNILDVIFYKKDNEVKIQKGILTKKK